MDSEDFNWGVDLGVELSVDYQTIGFKGDHVNKLCMTYKLEDDGLQYDVMW